MPVYLLHGFRWPRATLTGIRIHTIIHNLEEVSVDYIQNVNSTTEILKSFRTAFPDIMKDLEGPGKRGLTFLEQYDPEDCMSEDSISQPYAFVGDRVVTLAGGAKAATAATSDRPLSASTKNSDDKSSGTAKPVLSKSVAMDTSILSINVEDIIAEGPGVSTIAWQALADLRDKLAQDEKIGWWIVYNGDPERPYDDSDSGSSTDEEDSDDEDEEAEMSDKTLTPPSPVAIRTSRPTVPAARRDGNLPSQRPPVPAKDAPRPTPTKPHIPSQGTDQRTPAPLSNKGKRAEQGPATDSAKAKIPSRSGRLKGLFGEKERSKR